MPKSIDRQKIEIIRDDGSDDSDSVEVRSKPKVSFSSPTKPPAFIASDMEDFVNPNKRLPEGLVDEMSDHSLDDSASELSSNSGSSSASGGSSEDGSVQNTSSKHRKKQRKYELLSKLHQLERRGVSLSKSFTVKSRISDLEFEYSRLTKELNNEAGLKFARKALMAAVTGLEFANKRFDPIQAKLEGWSESVMENIDDYDKSLLGLVEKYGKSVEVAPEVELFMTLAGSGFMFHLSKSILQNPVGILNSMGQENPEMLENVMKNVMNSIRPDQLKQFEPKQSLIEPKQPLEITPPSVGVESDDDSDAGSSEYTNDSSDDEDIKFVPTKQKR